METITPQEQPQAEIGGLDRLENDFKGIVPEIKETITETVNTPDAELKDTTETPVKPEEVKSEVTEGEVKAAELKDEFEFKDNTEPAGETWKDYFTSQGYELPEDFSEEKGFEVYEKFQEEKYSAKIEEVKNFKLADIISEVPEPQQAEARLVLDLLKSGVSLEQINAPLQNIKELRSLSPEALVRKNLEGTEGWTPDMVDHEMEKLQTSGTIEIEHKKLLLYLDRSEKQINQERQQQIQSYTTQQEQLKEQKRQQEFNSFKSALSREKTFMDLNLKDSNREAVLRDYSNGYAEKILNDPAKLAKFMLWDKYGEQGVKYIQSRATEKATLEKSKSQHNIPQNIVQAGGNRASAETTHSNGMDRLQSEFEKK